MEEYPNPFPNHKHQDGKQIQSSKISTERGTAAVPQRRRGLPFTTWGYMVAADMSYSGQPFRAGENGGIG